MCASYGTGSKLLGSLGSSAGFAIFAAGNILTGAFDPFGRPLCVDSWCWRVSGVIVGVVAGDWHGSDRLSAELMVLSVIVLLGAIVLFGLAIVF